jgi:hypothetical protein
MTIAFTDAHGICVALTIDQAYTGIMMQISQTNAYQKAYYPQGPVGQAQANPDQPPAHPAPMLEGDFTEEEMTRAEQIMQEMGSAQNQAA